MGVKMKKIIIVITTFFLISGCSNSDINNESIVTTLYIDKSIHCIYIIPNEKDSYLEKIEGNGSNLFEMFNDIKNKSNKKLYFDHLATIVISEEITYNELKNFIEKTMITENVNIVIAKDIEEILKEYLTLAPFETPSATLNSKNVNLVNFKELKENNYLYLPFIGYDNKTIFIGYKKIQN